MRPRIHDRYLLVRFLRIFCFAVLAFVMIYITVDIFEEIDNFIDHDAKLPSIVRYYVYSLPAALTYVIPVSLLLATVFSMGLLARRNELTALLASGISLHRIARPIFVVSLISAAFAVYFNDVIVAAANRRMNDTKRHDIEGRARIESDDKADFRYMGSDGLVYLASNYSHVNTTLYDLVIQQFDGNTLVRRIDAKSARWKVDHWLLVAGYVRSFEKGAERVQAFDTLTVPQMREKPEDFAAEEIDEENMTLAELRRYIDRVEHTGGNAEKYIVDMHFKFSFPFAGMIFVLIGVALASGKRKPSVATGFGLTLVVSFIYYMVLRIGQTLGHNGFLPPVVAAQFGNGLFLAVGLFLLRRANR